MLETKRTLYRNWIKAGLGLLYAKEALQEFVSDEIDTFHTTIYKKVLQQLPPNCQCNSCTIQNVLKCRTDGTCVGKRCHFHDNTDPTKQYRPCPQNICEAIRDEVVKVHRYGRPTFKNSDAQVWFNTSWELAKCFMPPGYSNSTNADSTDFAGLIAVILCHEDFQKRITEKLDQTGNKFEKAREARNKIMHNPKMEFSTNDMNTCFQLLTDILSDKQYLQSLSKAQEAIGKLQELQKDLITITASDEERVRKESLDQLKKVTDEGAELIEAKTIEGIEGIDREMTEGIRNIDRKTSEGVQHIDRKTSSGVQHVDRKTNEGIENIDRKVMEGMEDIDRKINEGKEALQKEQKIGVEHLKETFEESRVNLERTMSELTDEVETIQKETKKAKRSIDEKKDMLVEDMTENAEDLYRDVRQKLDSHIQSSVDRFENAEKRGTKALQEKIRALQEERAKGFDPVDKDYDMRKTNLQKELIDHYSENGYYNSAILPPIDDEEMDVADMFEMPKMRIKQSSSKYSGSQRNGDMITTICDLFQTDGQNTRRTCISGEAGYGKTMLCQKILSDWCKLHTNRQTESLRCCDQTFLKSFEFLFYIPLRNHTTSDVIDMIKAELVRRDMHDLLDEILQRGSHKCFIILDGLDEWLPPQDCCKKIPIFDPREKATILITSRPWKLEVLRPKNSEIGHEVELCGVTDEIKCIIAVFDYLNKRIGENKIWNYKTFQRRYILVRDLLQVPILLTQIVCMWYDGMDFGETHVEVYCRMIEYLLQLANKRQQDKSKQNRAVLEEFKPRKTEDGRLLDIFKGLPFCQKYSDLLSRLSELAFDTLFSEKREASLVFPHSLTEIYKLNEVDLSFCLKAGLLSQAKFCSKLTIQIKKLSFVHKTVQELLAAVFIAHGDNDNKLNYMLQSLSCLKDVFEMSQVMLCLGGLRPDLIHNMSKHIAKLADQNEEVISRRSVLHYRHFSRLRPITSIKRIQTLICDMVEECYKRNKGGGGVINKVILLDIDLSWLNKTAREKLFECIKTDEVKSISMDYMSLTQAGSLWTRFNGANLWKLKVSINSQIDVGHLIDMIQNCLTSLTSVQVNGPKENPRLDIKHFLATLVNMTFLTSIQLTNIILEHSCMEQLGQFLSDTTQLKEIVLCKICCVTCEHTPCQNRIDLSNHRQLLFICIYGLTGQVTLCDGVPLEYCALDSLRYDPFVIACLKSSTSLKALKMIPYSSRYTRTENDGRKVNYRQFGLSTILTTVIPTWSNLKILDLNFIDLGQDLLRLSPNMIYLEHVDLDVKQTLESFKCFIDSLPNTEGVLQVFIKTQWTWPRNSTLFPIAVTFLSQRYERKDRGSEYSLTTFFSHNHIVHLES